MGNRAWVSINEALLQKHVSKQMHYRKISQKKTFLRAFIFLENKVEYIIHYFILLFFKSMEHLNYSSFSEENKLILIFTIGEKDCLTAHY